MSNIPFLAEEGNVIEGLHFYSYLGWGGGQDGNISVLPPPLNRYMNMYIQTHMYTTHKKRNHTGSQILRKSSTHTHKYTIIYEPIIQIIYTNCIWIRTPRIGPGVNRSKGPSTGSQEKITYRQKPSSGLQERIKLKSVLSSFVEFCENWQ